jgi:hypothetical protein
MVRLGGSVVGGIRVGHEEILGDPVRAVEAG